MPAVYEEAIERKRKNQQVKRHLKREEKIEDLGGIALSIPLCEPLTKEESKERAKYLYSLKNKGKTRDTYKKREGPSTKEQYAKKMVSGARSRTNGLRIHFDITFQDIEVPDICPITGLEIVLDYSNREQSPSLDRIIPELGYVKGNVSVISNRANRLKSDASLDELKNLVKYVSR